MASTIKFFSDLGKNLKSFVVLQWAKISQSRKIAQQKNLDKKIISQLNPQKMPHWRQFKQLPKTMTEREKLIVKILLGLILFCLLILFYFDYYSKLTTIPTNGGDFSEALIGSPLYINPLLAPGSSDADQDITHLVYSGLLKYNPQLELIPDLAEKYEISSDQKIYTFFLKKNVLWHDGEKFNASDVVFTIDSLKNADYKSPLLHSFDGIKAEKIDDYTVKFTLEQPYAAFLNLLTLGILPQHLWYDTPASNAKLAIYNQKPIGTGPFKFKSLVKEKSGLIKVYTLEKNKNYYAKVPYLNQIIFKFYPDYANAVDALINKSIQSIGYLPKDYVGKFSNKRDFTLYDINLNQYTAIFFNKKNNALLDNQKIRQVLAYAIDKNKISEDVLQNQGQIIDGPILPGFLGYDPNLKKSAYDPQKALEILTADGWTLNGDFLQKKDKKTVTDLKLTLTTVDQTENVKIANLLKDFWNSIGVNVDLQIVPKDKIEKEIIDPRNYQALLYGEIIGYDPDLYPFWHSSQKNYPGVNLANYVNKNTDKLLEEARLTNDPKIRQLKYGDFQKLLIDDLPAIFLYMPTYTYPVSKKIQGIDVQRISNTYDRFIDIENWYIKTKKKFIK